MQPDVVQNTFQPQHHGLNRAVPPLSGRRKYQYFPGKRQARANTNLRAKWSVTNLHSSKRRGFPVQVGGGG